MERNADFREKKIDVLHDQLSMAVLRKTAAQAERWYWVDEDLQNIGKASSGGPRGWPQRLGADRTFTDFCLTGTRVYTIASDSTLWRTGDLGNRHHYSGVIPVSEDTEAEIDHSMRYGKWVNEK